jgi:integron integrase
VRDAIRLKHYSYRTEQTYVQWIRRYILFHNKRHPNQLGVAEIEAFLTHLAVQEHVAASTQNQALSALLFLYREVLFLPLDARIDAVRAKPSRKLPTVLTKDEVRSVIVNMTGVHRLIVQTLYGSGLRLREAMQLRVKDLDFAQYQIVVRDAKGHDSRVTMLPVSLVEPLQGHLEGVQRLHQQDLEQGYGTTILPFALARKYPNANRQWHWQFVFPSLSRCQDPRSGIIVRYHLHESGVQKALKQAVCRDLYPCAQSRRARGTESPRCGVSRRAIAPPELQTLQPWLPSDKACPGCLPSQRSQGLGFPLP